MNIWKFSENGNLNHFQVIELSFQESLNYCQIYALHFWSIFHVKSCSLNGRKSWRGFSFSIKLPYYTIPYIRHCWMKLNTLRRILMTAFLLIIPTLILLLQTFMISIYNYLTIWGLTIKPRGFMQTFFLSIHSYITLILVEFSYEICFLPPHVSLKFRSIKCVLANTRIIFLANSLTWKEFYGFT